MRIICRIQLASSAPLRCLLPKLLAYALFKMSACSLRCKTKEKVNYQWNQAELQGLHARSDIHSCMRMHRISYCFDRWMPGPLPFVPLAIFRARPFRVGGQR